MSTYTYPPSLQSVGFYIILVAFCIGRIGSAEAITPVQVTMPLTGGSDSITRVSDLPMDISQMAGSSSGSGISSGGTQESNLGTFDIVINPGSTLAGNQAALDAFNRAAMQWESYIADPITVTIDADLASLDADALGQASSVVLQTGYNTLRNAMVSDALDELPDDSIVSSLPTAAQFSAFLPTGFSLDGNISAS